MDASSSRKGSESFQSEHTQQTRLTAFGNPSTSSRTCTVVVFVPFNVLYGNALGGNILQWKQS